MPLPLAMGAIGLLAKVAPDVIGLFAGDDSKEKKLADRAAGVARALTGQDDEGAAIQAIEADPTLLAEFEREARKAALDEMRIENERLATINRTMQVEAQSQDPYVRRWRPTFGYIVSLTWALQFTAVAYAMVATPAYAAELVQAVVALTPAWGIALAVLGVNVVKRSQDKEVAAGFQPAPGLVQRIFGRGKSDA